METYTVAIDAGWQIETSNNLSEYVLANPFCYLTLHGQKYGVIRVKECLFESVSNDVPPDVRSNAISQVARHREEIEDVYRYNRDKLNSRMGATEAPKSAGPTED